MVDRQAGHRAQTRRLGKQKFEILLQRNTSDAVETASDSSKFSACRSAALQQGATENAVLDRCAARIARGYAELATTGVNMMTVHTALMHGDGARLAAVVPTPKHVAEIVAEESGNRSPEKEQAKKKEAWGVQSDVDVDEMPHVKHIASELKHIAKG